MLSEFKAAKFRFTIVAREEMVLPAFKGSMLRGGFGHVFKKACCVSKQGDCASCLIKTSCPYAYVFEPSPPDSARHFSSNENLPRPYVFEPPLDDQKHFNVGDVLRFNLVLIGKAIDYLPYFIFALKELGEIGIGREWAKYRLSLVEAIDVFTDEGTPIFDECDGSLSDDKKIINASTYLDGMNRLPEDKVLVNFLSPTRIKFDKRWLFDEIPFVGLIQSLTTRLNNLNTYFCGGAWNNELRTLRDWATCVGILSTDIRKHSVARYSSRQEKKDSLSGVIGQVLYAGDLKTFYPILMLGQVVHVGKGCVFGCGRYEVN